MTRQFSENSFSISSDAVFWQGLKVRDTADIDYVDCKSFVAADAVAVPGFENWHIHGEPLLWYNKDKTAAFVNRRFLSKLRVVDLISLNGQLIAGTVEPDLLQEWPCEKIIDFLLLSGLVRTFVHSHAELQLIESVSGKIHRENYDACHFIYTNEEIRSDYKFRIEIDTQSGKITVASL